MCVGGEDKTTQWPSYYSLGDSRVSPGASGAAVSNEGCQAVALTQFHPRLFFYSLIHVMNFCTRFQKKSFHFSCIDIHAYMHTYTRNLKMLHVKCLAHIKDFINVFNTSLLCSSWVPWTVLAAEDTVGNKINIVSVVTELTV